MQQMKIITITESSTEVLYTHKHRTIVWFNFPTSLKSEVNGINRLNISTLTAALLPTRQKLEWTKLSMGGCTEKGELLSTHKKLFNY